MYPPYSAIETRGVMESIAENCDYADKRNEIEKLQAKVVSVLESMTPEGRDWNDTRSACQVTIPDIRRLEVGSI